MIETDPRLPRVEMSVSYLNALNQRLTEVLRTQATEIKRMQGSAWNGYHPVMGSYHLWIDATGDLRIKSSFPTSDLDGTVIGTQT